MRSLIVRFSDLEGPGLLETILREKGYSITFHDSYKKGLELVPVSHQIFDLIVLLGGPISVADPGLQSFFKPYYQLVKDSLSIPRHKVLGICLGSQIIAKALGSEVRKGSNGPEIGFGKLKVENPNSPVLKNVDGSNVNVFHLHEDTYDIPKGAEHLLSSEKYLSQMFSYQNRAFGIQCHMELNPALFSVWHSRIPEIKTVIPKNNAEVQQQIESVAKTGRTILENIINI